MLTYLIITRQKPSTSDHTSFQEEVLKSGIASVTSRTVKGALRIILVLPLDLKGTALSSMDGEPS